MSEQRKYSLDELDAMRRDIRTLHRSKYPTSGFGNSIEVAEVRITEDLLRTYMTNGTDPAELQERAKYLGLQRRRRANLYVARQNGWPVIDENESAGMSWLNDASNAGKTYITPVGDLRTL